MKLNDRQSDMNTKNLRDDDQDLDLNLELPNVYGTRGVLPGIEPDTRPIPVKGSGTQKPVHTKPQKERKKTKLGFMSCLETVLILILIVMVGAAIVIMIIK